jgi:hypothetical protein
MQKIVAAGRSLASSGFQFSRLLRAPINPRRKKRSDSGHVYEESGRGQGLEKRLPTKAA